MFERHPWFEDVSDAGQCPAVILVAQNQAIFGIEQGKPVGDALDRVLQPKLRLFCLLFGERFRRYVPR
jgi:hypothetical protein